MEPERNIEDTLSADEIRAAMTRIVASPAFSHSPQLVAFLRFVVDAVLAGKGGGIKSYTIAVEALGRPESFDPANDPIVRVEAGRLRKALARYYVGVGAHGPIIIELPLGTYVPVFRRPIKIGAARLALILISRLSGRSRTSRLAVASLALTAIGAGVLVLAYQSATLPEPATAATVGSIPARSAMPIVFIQAFDAIGTPAQAVIAPDELRRKLRDALARFDEIDVAFESAPPAGAPFRPGMRAAARSEYHLSATLVYRDNSARVLSFRLHDALDGTVAWARRFENSRPAGEANAAEDEIVRKVATTLAQPYGVIYARELGRVGSGNGDAHYRCLLDAIVFRPGVDPAAHQRLRTCLQQATTSDPTFAGGFAALAMLAVRDYYQDLGSNPAMLDRALQAAMRAIELAPASARAHQALMNVLFARGQISAALAEGNEAVSLNPYDMTVLTAYGARVAASGDLQKGAALLRQAAAETPVRPSTLNFALFLAAYLLGDDADASYQAGLLAGDTYPYALLARALAALRANHRQQARQAMEKLFALNPAWRNDARARLERLIPSPAIVARVSSDLAALQLVGTP